MAADVHRLVSRQGAALAGCCCHTAALACVSNDSGFAAMLRFAASRGVATLAVTDPLRTRRRPPWAPPPDYGRHPLPAAAGRCLVWDERWLPEEQQAAEEAELVIGWAKEAGLPLPPLPCAGSVAGTWTAEPPD
ncbi:hypothetical protein CHLNCDRAFT_54097 [Chlorella variabilis]|uniref:Uncharacterized protein n=1 Tax=Chlorella variabilis TaxID=554065 RepID=E1ZMH7_CHLVA|nr:hypothetical protein CHLNCDRAFT_54097 [Chlorella variabilis]EFN53114.1 hypothetical protein CHLNCDRAFT_54097 [Chlorella variabilis]|eukprot:XP_005845216.1 hypothetical protein CHLNCDRAFT_54097 [Chlorella variabilis]